MCAQEMNQITNFYFTFSYTQGCSILLATVLKTLEKDKGKHYDSDNDYAVHRLPFVNNSVHPLPYAVADFPLPSKSETWMLRKDSQ